jgi:hypothetical protein
LPVKEKNTKTAQNIAKLSKPASIAIHLAFKYFLINFFMTETFLEELDIS